MLAIFLTTLTITAPVFAMLFLGVLLKRINWINDNFISGLATTLLKMLHGSDLITGLYTASTMVDSVL